MSRRSLVACAVSAALFGGFSANANAAAFALIEQGVKGLGNAYAGGAAAAEDATTVFFNPAGMTRLSGSQLTVAAHIIRPSAKFSNSGSTTALGTALTGGDGGEAGEQAVVPNFYYVQDIGPGMKFGLGINAPFGLATEYDSDWVGRYQAIRSEIRTININPSFAMKVNDELSVGFGLSYQKMDAELSSAVDYSAACIDALGVGTCNAVGLGVATFQSATTTGGVVNKADGSSWGFNFGFLYEFTPQTRGGFAYRSKIKHELSGDADFSIPTAVSSAPGGVGAGMSATFADTGLNAKVTLPEMFSVSVFHHVNNQLALMGDITRTRWSRLPELRLDFDSTLDDGVEDLQWKDASRFSFGASYAPDESWTWRGGVAYDQSPIPDAEHTTSRLPDNERKWVALGGSYRPNKSMTVDFGYAHLFVSDTDVNRTGSQGDHLRGTFKSAVDILSAQLNWSF